MEFERVDAVSHDIGWVGCALSHQRCIKIAIDRGLPWVLVLEDDVMFDIDSLASFDTILSQLWAMQDLWERFNGGPTLPRPNEIWPFDLSCDLFYVDGLTTHFSLYNCYAYPYVLNWRPVDRDIDLYLYNLGRNERTFRSVSHRKHLAYQIVDYSDIANGSKDYSEMFLHSSDRINRFADDFLWLGDRFRTLDVSHPNWEDKVIISTPKGRLFHYNAGSRGKFLRSGEVLSIFWDMYGQEDYVLIGKRAVHVSLAGAL